MTITGRLQVSAWDVAVRVLKIRAIGRVSRDRYELHARSPAVQQLIEDSRDQWRQRYGDDPAAARLERAP